MFYPIFNFQTFSLFANLGITKDENRNKPIIEQKEKLQKIEKHNQNLLNKRLNFLP